MFSKDWFLKQQKLLLWLLNTPLIRTWFRWIFSINGKKSSVGKRDIIRIEPHAITWLEGVKILHSENYKKIKAIPVFSTEFRTHNKFSKRLFYAFYPIWYLLHLWDTLFANNFQPTWNLGFDTLTVYPDPDPETTSVDGEVRRTNIDATWTAARDTADGAVATSIFSPQYVVGERFSSGGNYSVYRLFFLFDTSALTASATISAATFSIYQTGVTMGDQTTGLIQTSPASNTDLVLGDYDAMTINTPDEGASRIDLASGYNDFSMNATGLTWISKTSITKLGCRASRDIDNTTPPDTPRQYDEISMADQAGTTQDPKLVVTYTIETNTLDKWNPKSNIPSDLRPIKVISY